MGVANNRAWSSILGEGINLQRDGVQHSSRERTGGMLNKLLNDFLVTALKILKL